MHGESRKYELRLREDRKKLRRTSKKVGIRQSTIIERGKMSEEDGGR